MRKIGDNVVPHTYTADAEYSPSHVYRTVIENAHGDSVYPLGRDYWASYDGRPCYDHFASESILSVYVHVPFCLHKCAFCPFETLPAMSPELQEAYTDALLKEITLYAESIGDRATKSYCGFDIGGGTPTLLTPANIEKIWQAVMGSLICGRLSSDWLPSIETTAEIASRDYPKLRLLSQLGCSRISMGIQTTDTRLLDALNRASQSRMPYDQALANCRKAGFDLVNVDVMYGLPHQSMKSLEANLKYVARDLHPDSITIYETRYYRTTMSLKDKPSRHEAAALYKLAYETLLTHGYQGRFGTAFFSSAADRSACSSYLSNRHLKCMPFIGLGAGAQGMSARNIYFNYLSDNGVDAGRYIRGVTHRNSIERFHVLPGREMVAKHIALSLQFHGLVNCAEVSRRSGLDLREQFGDSIDFAIQNGLMTEDGQRLYITEKGFLNRDGIVSIFLTSEARRVLLAQIAHRPE